MSSLPVDLKDRSYNHSDFIGRGYVGSYPDFLRDASFTLLNPVQGYCTTAVPLLPSLKLVTLTCSRNRAWTAGLSLIFQGVTSLQMFVLRVHSYDPASGLMTGAITNILASSTRRLNMVGEVKSDTQWRINVSLLGTRDYNQNTGVELPVASGGLGAKLISEANDARANLGMDYFGGATLKVEDDFLGLGERFVVGANGASPFTISGFNRPEAADPYANWGMIKGEVAALNSVAAITAPASSPNKNSLRITTNANTDFMITTRIYLSALSDGANRVKLAFGYANDDAIDLNRATMFYDAAISPNWIYETINGSTASQSASAVAVVAGSLLILTIIKVAGTITFYVNGASIGTKTTNFPATAVHPMLHLKKTLGSGARYILADYIRLNHRNGT